MIHLFDHLGIGKLEGDAFLLVSRALEDFARVGYIVSSWLAGVALTTRIVGRWCELDGEQRCDLQR